MGSVRVYARGGLGNQLHSLAAGILAAFLRGGGVVVDGQIVSRSGTPSRQFQLHHFEYRVDPRIPIRFRNIDPSRGYTRARAYRRLVRLTRHVPGTSYYWESDERGLASLAASAPKILDGHFEGPFTPLRCLELGLLQGVNLRYPSDAFLDAVDRIERSDTIAVHVRLGDFLTTRPELVLDESYYAEALSEMGYRRGRTRVFLFSDDQTDAAQLLQSSGVLLEDLTCSSKRLTAPEDLVAMSRARSLILSNSSFAWWAALLGDVPSVVAPATAMSGPSTWNVVR